MTDFNKKLFHIGSASQKSCTNNTRINDYSTLDTHGKKSSDGSLRGFVKRQPEPLSTYQQVLKKKVKPTCAKKQLKTKMTSSQKSPKPVSKEARESPRLYYTKSPMGRARNNNGRLSQRNDFQGPIDQDCSYLTQTKGNFENDMSFKTFV